MNDHEKMTLLKRNVPSAAYGANLTMYSIALEAWRRGLKVSFFTKNIKNSKKLRYKISTETKSYTFSQSLNYDVIPKSTRQITVKKDATKKLFAENNVPTPKGKIFPRNSAIDEIIEYSTTLNFPLIIKPASSSLGKGVITNIETIPDLKMAIQESNLNENNLTIEEQATGDDVRVFVIDDKVVSAFKRVPSHVTGDGKKSIEQLIKDKNKLRRNNPHAYKYQTNIDSDLKKYLENKGLNIDTIPKNNEIITLTDTTLQAFGAETVDVTDELSDESKQVAINATKSVKNLKVCGVDIMIDNVMKTNYVLELNSRPYLGGGMFPLIGIGRDLPRAVVDLYFPETKGTNSPICHQNLYYDFDLIKESLTSGEIASFTLPTLDINNFSYAKHYLKTASFKDSFSNWLKKRAVAYHLNGYIKMIDKFSAELVVLGDTEHLNSLLDELDNYGNNKRKVSIVKSDEQPIEAIMAGFMIKRSGSNKMDNIQQGNVEALKKEVRLLKKQNKNLTQEKNHSFLTKVKKRIKRLLK